jgi:Mrp family chromosome partitioning ATPase
LRRLAAAAARQRLAFFATAVAITLAGLGAALLQRAPTANAVIFWSGVGACVGLAFSLFRELTRATITSVSSLGRQRGYSLLGAAPELNAGDLRDLAPDQRTPLGCLAFLPGSTFATAFRDLQGALSDESVVAFLSPDTSDGAMAAMCAAASAAQQGRRVIVVDCDPRARALTRGLGIEPDQGIQDAIANIEGWREIVGEEPETGLDYIPAMQGGGSARPPAELAGFAQLLEELKAEYELVVLACPPAEARSGAIELAARADKIVIVAAWDETPLSTLRRAIRALRSVARAPLGVFVSRVPHGRRFGRLRPS